MASPLSIVINWLIELPSSLVLPHSRGVSLSDSGKRFISLSRLELGACNHLAH